MVHPNFGAWWTRRCRILNLRRIHRRTSLLRAFRRLQRGAEQSICYSVRLFAGRCVRSNRLYRHPYQLDSLAVWACIHKKVVGDFDLGDVYLWRIVFDLLDFPRTVCHRSNLYVVHLLPVFGVECFVGLRIFHEISFVMTKV